MPRPSSFLWVVLASSLASGCSSGPKAEPAPHRAMMASTTAGAERCVLSKSHDRPFVIEWDATDLATFEAKAARDVVFVHYEGCVLSVVYGCTDEGVPGRYGTYGTPMWTTGTVEQIDIRDELSLWRELPLGAAQLSSHVSSGEALHLRYFVSGVASATRETIYRSDLSTNPACAPATHYVWAYNLGAFELGTESAASASAGGGESATIKGARVLKHAGILERCTTEDLRACRAPIRLALRKIEEGDRPAIGAPTVMASSVGPVTSSSTSPAPMPPTLAAGEDGHVLAAKLRSEAHKKEQLGDGPGCLAALDRAVRVDPKPINLLDDGDLRARCEMRAGKCEEGRRRLTAVYSAEDVDRKTTEDRIKDRVSHVVLDLCPEGSGNASERAMRSAHKLGALTVGRVEDGPIDKDIAAQCIKYGDDLEALLPKLPDGTPFEKDAINRAQRALYLEGIRCATRAGRCDRSWAYHKASSTQFWKAPKDENIELWMARQWANDNFTCDMAEGSLELKAYAAAHTVDATWTHGGRRDVTIARARTLAKLLPSIAFDQTDPPKGDALRGPKQAAAAAQALWHAIVVANLTDQCGDIDVLHAAYVKHWTKWLSGKSHGKPYEKPACPRKK